MVKFELALIKSGTLIPKDGIMSATPHKKHAFHAHIHKQFYFDDGSLSEAEMEKEGAGKRKLDRKSS